ncbi:hypothetical protein [Terrimonas alba]|uniref:hypothetical protein n=1 Tax=Terrimonas alba TaxID=3349636 RepID=UPI0035F4980E
MKRIISTLLFSLIMVAGLFIGMIKGQEVRNRWVSKMKTRHEERRSNSVAETPQGEVVLDEIEMATYHS